MSHFLYKRLINLDFLHNPFLKSFTRIATTPSQSFTVDYLINSCGLSLEAALSTSKTINLNQKNSQNLDYVLKFLESSGFSKTQITNLITELPKLLRCRVDTHLKTKFQFLLEMGFSTSNISELIISSPSILKRNLDNQLRPSFVYLKRFVLSNENIVKAVKRSKHLITFDVKQKMVPNVSHLVKQGVSSSNISKLIMLKPNAIMLGGERFVEIVEMVKKLGFEPESTMFIYGVEAMSSLNKSAWERKLEVFKSLGWSEEEIMMAIKRKPTFIRCSEEKIRRGVDFFMNTLMVDRSVILMNPGLLVYALDKRIFPRYVIIQILKSKNLLMRCKKFVCVFNMSEKLFLQRYVLKNVDKVPDLLEVYRSTNAVNMPNINGGEVSKVLQFKDAKCSMLNAVFQMLISEIIFLCSFSIHVTCSF